MTDAYQISFIPLFKRTLRGKIPLLKSVNYSSSSLYLFVSLVEYNSINVSTYDDRQQMGEKLLSLPIQDYQAILDRLDIGTSV